MIQETNHPPPCNITSFILSNAILEKANIIAQAKTAGYIRAILFLYQLSNLSAFPKNKVKPEQKKKRAFPMEPPVARIL
jgi:hypothetical protein